ncbi:MAG: alpha/beta hydrolase [Bacillota bacterium]|nr:alpha/beta hydrolase [Bacillota bacterium]
MHIIQETIGRQNCSFTAYLPERWAEAAFGPRPGVLILPGGGYGFTSTREAEPIALAWNAAGYNAYVLHYTTRPGTRWPTALTEALTALHRIRDMAAAWDQDPARVAVTGFSAGAHLAADLATVSADKEFLAKLGFDPAASRPDAAILCYPVISGTDVGHRGSFENLLGDRIGDPEALARVSLETRVTGETPPCFLWHTANDEAVPVENSLLFAMALARAGVPFELHVYPDGAHGLSLGTWFVDTPQPSVQGWIAAARHWLDGVFGCR